MRISGLGHAFLKVRDRGRSEGFYSGVLGLAVAARLDAPPMTFFTLGNHRFRDRRRRRRSRRCRELARALPRRVQGRRLAR
jgi:catechol 2,3-dioxygenase-like lactoylglutathione lyase family enzyme